MARYQYQYPLTQREIRLIDIERWKNDEWNDEINFSLRVCPIDECPPYVALSYAWGDPTNAKACYCDGLEFPVAESLRGALITLRTRDTPSPVWIDSICINQDDLAEKSRQVSMMREIYSRATATIIWLGETCDGDIVATQLMRNLNSVYPNPRMIPQKGSIYEPGRTQEFNHLARPEELGLPPLISPEWSRLIDFYKKPWFSRVWIIQELCAARLCVMWCGNSALQPFVVLNAALKMVSYPGLGSGRWNDIRVPALMNAATLADLQDHFQRESSGFIFGLLRLTRDFKATIPHDRLFALLGIADNGVRGQFVRFPVDYRQSITDTYIAFMRWALDECKFFGGESALALLSYACHPSTSQSLPSWVPRWDAHLSGFTFLAESSRRRIPEDDLHSPEKSHYWADLKAFFVQARLLSRAAGYYHSRAGKNEALIRTLCLDCGGKKASTLEMSESDFQLVDAFEKCVSVLSNIQSWEHTPISEFIPWKTKRDSYYVSGQINLIVFLLTILAMVVFRRYPGAWWQWLLYICGLAAFDWTGQQILRFVPGIGNVAEAREQLPKLFASAWPVFENYADFWSQRSLCLTDGGRLGLVTERVQPGDELCVINGCGLVFVLRSAQEEGQYHLISDAHVQGCMQGEIHARTDLTTREIALV
ncbi:uncharacterized protein Z520_10915 [Fonsecaea multimorphosa CBS 102226]|uniref:Heterokaryon incompatibility domain-containing protein n=1 Tax=Fonsecaea multimorphosa CBS 102226 TaxID=1442371 RepID=A0A0D2JJA5_9EURO|nr:uncharacterized protein Z520_10915 [Fonsecaea multimorphosa CBS 102226]KIX93272.1 hypothetical protein Z520_10915 [Fonsecaea multimorphosa CBS 102226]